MRKVVLELKENPDKKEYQNTIKEVFGFSKNYGMNLDALYDELTAIGEGITIKIIGSNEDAELKKIIKVIKKSMENNKNIRLEN